MTNLNPLLVFDPYMASPSFKIFFIAILLLATTTVFFEMENDHFSILEAILLCCVLGQYVDTFTYVSCFYYVMYHMTVYLKDLWDSMNRPFICRTGCVVFYLKHPVTYRSPEKSEWHDGQRRLATGKVH